MQVHLHAVRLLTVYPMKLQNLAIVILFTYKTAVTKKMYVHLSAMLNFILLPIAMTFSQQAVQDLVEIICEWLTIITDMAAENAGSLHDM